MRHPDVSKMREAENNARREKALAHLMKARKYLETDYSKDIRASALIEYIIFILRR